MDLDAENQWSCERLYSDHLSARNGLGRWESVAGCRHKEVLPLADGFLSHYHPSMARTPYSGTSRKLVLAFDIGTTYSGAAYAFLDPGEVPEITPVTRCGLSLSQYLTAVIIRK